MTKVILMIKPQDVRPPSTRRRKELVLRALRPRMAARGYVALPPWKDLPGQSFEKVLSPEATALIDFGFHSWVDWRDPPSISFAVSPSIGMTSPRVVDFLAANAPPPLRARESQPFLHATALSLFPRGYDCGPCDEGMFEAGFPRDAAIEPIVEAMLAEMDIGPFAWLERRRTAASVLVAMRSVNRADHVERSWAMVGGLLLLRRFKRARRALALRAAWIASKEGDVATSHPEMRSSLLHEIAEERAFSAWALAYIETQEATRPGRGAVGRRGLERK
ncbi:MAG: hypothetical protein IPK81_07335 [Rhodospirillales bacterium]|nr:MAG: hypothetical protein IPK81_07335 [Rhodospirillales bacterium]